MASDLLYLRAGELVAHAAQLLPGITRAYVCLDVPALDCADTVTVHVTQLGRQATDEGVLPEYRLGPALTGAVNVVTYVVTTVRCAPTPADTGDAPTPMQYEQAAELILEDLWLLWKGVPRGIIDGDLWAGACEAWTLGPAQSIPEQGGMTGWTLPVTAELS